MCSLNKTPSVVLNNATEGCGLWNVQIYPTLSLSRSASIEGRIPDNFSKNAGLSQDVEKQGAEGKQGAWGWGRAREDAF